MAEKRRALVIGASSGIGAALVKDLAGRGFEVIGVARRDRELRAVTDEVGAIAYAHDAARHPEVAGVFDRIVAERGPLDLVVYAAAVMPEVGPATFDTTIDAHIIEVNLLGAMAWLNAAANHFLPRGRGHIVGISSIAGDRGRRGNPAYHTSKAALNTYLESLRNRLSVRGIRVTTIKPGYVDTPMLKNVKKRFWVCPPSVAAKSIVDAALAGVNERYVYRRWALVGLVIRSIPSFLFRRMDI